MRELWLSLRRLARKVLPRRILRRELFKILDRQVAERREPELPEVVKLVAPGGLCLDIGSNIGLYSYVLAQHGCPVIAFEPNPGVAKTVSLIGMGVEVRQMALSSSDGSANLSVPIDNHGLSTLRSGVKLPGRVKQWSVTTRRLDGLGLSGVRFVKIDVEGFEEDVLEGGHDTIARDQPVLLIEIEERHNAGALARIEERLRRLGYEGFFLDAGAWQPLSRFDQQRDQPMEGIRAMEQGTPQGSVRYINNFLFLPPGRTPP
jgi:FkbM family methyltransferase